MGRDEDVGDGFNEIYGNEDEDMGDGFNEVDGKGDEVGYIVATVELPAT